MYPYGIRDVRDVKECAISGAKIRPGDVAVSIAGTGLFYRIASRVYKQLTPELQAEIEAWIMQDAGVYAAPVNELFPEAIIDTENTGGFRGSRKSKDWVETPVSGDNS